MLDHALRGWGRRDAFRFRTSISPLGGAVMLFTLALVTFGGAEVLVDWRGMLIAVTATAFSVVAVALGGHRGLSNLPRLTVLALALGILIVLVEIVPLPAGWLSSLPDQTLRQDVLNMAAAGNYWRPISLTPIVSTYGAILTIAFFISVASITKLRDREILWLVYLLGFIISVNICIGVCQILSNGSLFRLWEFDDYPAMIGTFANKNHMAIIICTGIPIISYIMTEKNISYKLTIYFITAILLVALILVIGTNSRAGLFILFFSYLETVNICRGAIKRKGQALTLTALIPALFFLVFLISYTDVAARFGDLKSDIRWDFIFHSADLIKSFSIFGSGLGSFAQVYRVHEKVSLLNPFYVNNLHNDYAQALLETGVFGLMSVLLFGVSVLRAFTLNRILPDDNTSLKSSKMRALMLLVVLVFGIHSLVDYPLRRPEALAFFMTCAAIGLRNGRDYAN